MTNLNTVLLGVGAGEAKLADIQTPMARFTEHVGRARRKEQDRAHVLALADHRRAGDGLRKSAASSKSSRGWISMPWNLGAEASNAIRAAARSLNLYTGAWRAGAADGAGAAGG